MRIYNLDKMDGYIAHHLCNLKSLKESMFEK